MGEEAGDASQNRGRKASMHRAVSGETAQVSVPNYSILHAFPSLH